MISIYLGSQQKTEHDASERSKALNSQRVQDEEIIIFYEWMIRIFSPGWFTQKDCRS